MKDEMVNLLNEAEKLFEQEGNLIRLESGRGVFIGDTHGDIDATQRVLDKYLGEDRKVVFLGDYVDRGPESAENLNLLLRTKIERPDDLFLLMGNHEGYKAIPFYPADFWEGLDRELRQRYAAVLSKLPLVVSTANGVIASHGALPYVETLEDITRIKLGSREWQQVTWGDWRENEASDLGSHAVTGRPQFGREWFDAIMRRLGKNVLIRSHQPDIAPVIYDRRCLTIFTSSVYRALVPQRTVAIADLGKEIRTVDDLVIETI